MIFLLPPLPPLLKIVLPARALLSLVDYCMNLHRGTHSTCHSTIKQTLERWAVEPGDNPEMSQQQWDWTVQVWYLPLRLRIPFCWLQTCSSSALLLTGCSSVKVKHSDCYFSPFKWEHLSLLRSSHKLSCFVTEALGMFLQTGLLRTV